MPVILKQNEIEIYADEKGRYVTISETDGHYNEHNGQHEDVFINIDVVHIDTVIAALQKCKKEIQGGDWVNNG